MSRQTCLQALGAALLPLLVPPAVPACPFCAGPNGEGNPVREAIFGADFGANLLVTAAPFAIFLLVAALVHYGLPWPGRIRSTPSREGGRE